MQTELYAIADELRATACQGLYYASSPYDRERYQRVLAASARLVAALEQRPASEVLEIFQDNLHALTPLAAAEAAVYQQGRLLLIRRSDNGLWALPGGAVEVGETLAQAAQRELWEETGVRGRPVRLLGVFDSRRWHSRTKLHLYHTVFEVAAPAPAPQPSLEALEAAFFAPEALPALAPGHDLRVPLVARLLSGAMPAPYFDAID